VSPRAVRLALGCALALLACGDSAGRDREDPVIAKLGGEPIRKSDVSAAAAFRLYRHEVATYTLLEQETERLVEERLLAAEARRRGLEPAELLAQVEAAAPAPTEADVDRYLADHPEAGPADVVRPRLRHYLERSARVERRLAFLAKLREEAGFEWLLPRPVPPRTAVVAPRAPARGPEDAPLTLVHFASFGSAASARSARTLERLFEEFPGRVRWLHVNLPREDDEAGRRAAELGFAAQEAGRFWQLHDALFARAGRLDAEALDAAAREAGLPGDVLARADRAELARRLDADLEVAQRAGALREPTLFVNGLYWSALRPYAGLRRRVEQELARSAGGG
jgi:protein-disulfide isomerase